METIKYNTYVQTFIVTSHKGDSLGDLNHPNSLTSVRFTLETLS
jgi:hypothetical protein